MSIKKIQINEELCTGCGNCVVKCHQSAIEIIGGKAKLVRENFCDGLGKCIKTCPSGALKIVEKEDLINKAKNINEVNKDVDREKAEEKINKNKSGCCGGLKVDRQWPIQLKLVPLEADYFKDKDLLVMADCVGFSYEKISELKENKSLVIACPKLDENSKYIQKLRDIINRNNIKKVTVAFMEVPCCNGLVWFLEEAVSGIERKVEIEKIQIGINGKIIQKIRK